MYSAVLSKVDNSCYFLLGSLDDETDSEITGIQGKNLLLEEQMKNGILFMGRNHMLSCRCTGQLQYILRRLLNDILGVT